MIQQKQLERFFAIVAIAVLFFCSYRAFAPLHTPDLNADRAIHVLMAADLKLPQDFYYWGQNRLGSIVPLLSAGVLAFLPLSPVAAVSLVQYGLLLVGYLCFASLLRQNLSKVILAFVWFLPLPEFIELVYTGQPYAAQLAFLGMAIVLLNHLLLSHAKLNQWTKQGLIVAAILCLTVSLWASDFTIVTIGLLICYVLYKTHSPIKIARVGGKWNFSLDTRPQIITLGITAILGLLFVLLAKSTTSSRGSVGSLFNFNSPTQIGEVAVRLTTSLIHTLTFQTAQANIFKTVSALLLLVALGYAVYLLWQQPKRGQTSHTLSDWCYGFGANAGISVVMLILSKWVYQNDVNLRYFVVAYVSGWMAVLLLVEALTPVDAKRVQVLLLVAAIAGSLALPRYVFSREKPPATVETFRPLIEFAPAGVIGDYWMSYNVCSTDPGGLSCTPHDGQNRLSCPVAPLPPEEIQGVRCDRCAERVLAAERIFLVKDRWFEDFPDETTQFGQCLIRVGEPFSVGKYQFALYQNRTRQQTNAVGQNFP